MSKFIKGTIRKMNLESGFWGLTTAGGDNYQLISPPDGLKRNGIDVIVKVNVLENIASSSHWGTPVQVESYEEE